MLFCVAALLNMFSKRSNSDDLQYSLSKGILR